MDENLSKIIQKEFSTSDFNIEKEFEGNTHIVYLVKINNRFFIIRISKHEHKKFESEMWALKQFEKWSLPCARLIGFSNKKDLGEFNYSVLTFVEGEHPESSNAKAFESLSDEGLILIHKKDTKKFGDLNGKGIGEYNFWNEYLTFKFNKAFPNLKKNKILNLNILSEIEFLWREIGHLIQYEKGKFLLGDLHNMNFFVKDDKFYSFIDLKSILSGDPLWDYALIYYYNKQFIWPKYIKLDDDNKKKFYFYCLLISINKIWFSYKKQRSTKEAERKLSGYIQKLKELI